MATTELFRVTIRANTDSLWVREELFTGSLEELIIKFGTRKSNPLKPYKKDGKIYIFYFSEFIDGHWYYCRDPRVD